MIRVIINADDLGKDEITNNAISDALEKKLITSSTILANTNTWPQVHEIVKTNPQASFGVHLNLTEGKAMTENLIFHKYKIVDKDNCFTKQIQNQKYYPEELINAIFLEWNAQIEKIKTIEKVSVSHFDGHHHVHTIPELETVLIALLKKHNIKAVRRNYRLPQSFINCFNEAVSFILHKKAYRLLWRKKLKNIKTTDYFDSYKDFVTKINKEFVLPKECTIELMCHPGHEKYVEEDELMNEGCLGQRLPSILLISYKEL